MSTIKQTFRLTALSAALMMAFGPALADEAEVNELIKPDSSVSLGIGNWSGDRHQQGIYDGMREKGVYGLLDADIIKRDDATGTWYTLKAQNLGLENRELRIDVLRQGNVGGYFEYNKTPRDNPWTFNTGLQGLGTSRQIVSGSGALAFPKRQVELGTVREMLNGGFYKNLLPGLDFKIDFKNEEKTGTRQWGGDGPRFLAEPIDNTIRQLEATLQYAGTKLQLSGGYYGSWFEQNNGGLVSFGTNVAAPALPALTHLSQPLSNQAHQGFIDGGYNFTPTTRGTFKVAYTRATQDEQFPTRRVAPTLAGSPSSLDGRIDTTLVQLGISSRPLPKLSLNANLRYHDVNDKTPVAQFIAGNLGFNTPHTFTKTSGKLEGTYRLPQNFSLTAGMDYYTQDRSVPSRGQWLVPYRTELNETTYRLQLRRSFDDNLNGSIAYLYSDRTGSTTLLATTGDLNESRISPMHIADRKRDKVRAKIDWEPLDKLSLQFAVEGARDDYGSNNQPWGLKEGSAWLTSLDASYTFNDDWKLNAWLSHEDMSSTQDVAPTAAIQPANKVNLEEVTNSIGLGLLGKITSKFSFGADLEWLRSVTKHNQNLSITTFTANFRPVPDIENKLTRIKFKGIYAVAKNADIRLDLVHERWLTDDWSWSAAGGVPFCYTSCTGIDGTTVTASPTQNSTFAGLRYIYKFQ
ncbi:MtrB/PioB family decaheme-associated outer membrane protein [Dechloromonas sp. A34]|uniref:MtrB/PioB family decaheme-associated outer membrane protein n=1 Tax=Dechloromonas sp. A34 TaxID=447588 RepID=UPI002248DFDF|nr:MtrB/PioB family decaheme-associated outer membrane protein [Dechloromonas sp. A34]